MTIGIAAICEDGDSAVVAADKMVRFGAPMNLQAEPPTLKKLIEVTPGVLLVFSGGSPDVEEIIAGIAVDPQQPVGGIAAAVRDSYIRHRQRRVDENILKPLLGAELCRFQDLIAQSAASQFWQQIFEMIGHHNLQTDLLVVGMDDSGAHVFAVTHPGQLISLATTGFGAVGAGAIHAEVRMFLSQHTQSATLVDTLHRVYEAKRVAEVAPEVGGLTDLAIIRGGKIHFVGKNLLDALDKVHKEKLGLNPSEQAALQKALDQTMIKAGRT